MEVSNEINARQTSIAKTTPQSGNGGSAQYSQSNNLNTGQVAQMTTSAVERNHLNVNIPLTEIRQEISTHAK